MLRWRRRHGVVLVSLLLGITGFLFLPVVHFTDPTNTVLEDREGALLAARITDDGQWRFPDCDSVPRKIGVCIRLFEDEYFRYHPGVNPVSLGKALVSNLRAGEIVRGGSTLTMQVVRLSRKGKPRTIVQKSVEILLALRLELSAPKEEIFRLYASHAPFGGNVVGIDAAAWRYYGRPSHQLSWGEAATLAVLPNAPALIHPGRNRELLISRRNSLLDKLLEKGILDSLSCELARWEPLPEHPRSLPQATLHLLDRAEREGKRGQRLTTTIDRELQERINRVVAIRHQHYRQNEIHNAAVLVLDIPRREVLAYVGNTPAEEEGSGRHVDIIQAPRSSGSILKPLLYTLMLDEGAVLPGRLVPDIPTQISGYTPLNFDRSFSGAVGAGTALVRSLNVPAVRMLQEYGLEKFHARLQAAGFSTIRRHPGHYGLTLILGGAEVTLWDLGTVYMGMANTLNHIQAYDYRYDPDEFRPPSYEVSEPPEGEGPGEISSTLTGSGMFSAGAVWQCFETLQELERPTQLGSWERFSSARRVAWKTGTSFGFRDAWAVGVNPEYLVAVWVGNADGEGRPGLTGVLAAAPLMFEVFQLLPAASWFEPPYDELVELEVCRQSGYRVGPDCGESEIQRVPVSAARGEACPYHRIVHLDRSGKFRVRAGCYEVARMNPTPWFVLSPVMEWYYRKSDPTYRSLPPFLPGCAEPAGDVMEMIYPRESSRIFIPRGLDGERSRVVLEVAHRNAATTIYWHLDELYLGETSLIHQMEILAEPGWHTLTLVDSDGNHLDKRFRVVGE